MANQDLYKQAIAEAKSIRETAVANAKQALEETLTPHIKSLLAARLQEMEEEDEDANVVKEEDEDMDEMQGAKGNHEEVDEAEDKKADEEEKEEAEDDSEKSEDEAEEAEEEIEVKDMEVEDLKNLIRDIVAQEMGGMDGEGEEDLDMDMGLDGDAEGEEQAVDMVGAEDEEIDLDELLAELEGLSAETPVNEAEKAKKKKGKEEEEVNEFFWNKKDKSKEKPSSQPNSSTQRECPDGHEKWKDGRCYPTTYDDFNSTKPIPRLEDGYIINAKNPYWNEAKVTKDLKEALATINTLRADLSEVNLLNAKLLYLNKIFRATNLTEAQKASAISAFDKAASPKEVKLVYETLKEGFVTKKETIKEHKGFASKAAGVAPNKEIISEVSEQVRRMQKLAGII